MIELNRNPSARDLKWFGLLLLAFFGLLAAMAQWRFGAPSSARLLLAVGAALSAVYYAVPPLRRWIFLAWMFAAFPIGWTISHVLLFVVYFGVLTPVGLVLRVLGKDPLDRAFDRDASSYWIARPRVDDPRRYFRQF
jgi:hypothetical protein